MFIESVEDGAEGEAAGLVVFRAPSTAVAEWAAEHYGWLLAAEVGGVIGLAVRVEVR